MASSILGAKQLHVLKQSLILDDNRDKKFKLRQDNLAAKANHRRQKWILANQENDAIADSKFSIVF